MFIFSEPHDGIHGPAMVLPEAVKNVIDGMDGECMSLATALCRIAEAKPEGLTITPHTNEKRTGGWIELREGSIDNLPCHVWKLIEYSEESL